MGSAAETEYHVLLATDLGYLGKGECAEAMTSIQEVKRMLASLLMTARARSGKTQRRPTNADN
jgi:four helix bundle protein